MSRTYNSKQRGFRKIRNKIYTKNFPSYFDDIWHTRNKDRTKSRQLRKRLKQQDRKDIFEYGY